MALTKKERQQVHDKFGGRCAYCGDPLTKGWHADHAKPVERKYKYVGGGPVWKETQLPVNMATEMKPENYAKIEWTKRRLVQDGYHKPENDVIENMMPSCRSCNINKHGMNVEEFREFITRFISSLNKRFVQYKIAKRYGLIEETGKPVVFYFETYNTNRREA